MPPGLSSGSFFDAILTSEDFERSKPDPDCYLKGAALFGAERDECVVFEDSFNGLKAGRAARNGCCRSVYYQSAGSHKAVCRLRHT